MPRVFIHDIGRYVSLPDEFSQLGPQEQGDYIDDVVNDYNTKKPTWSEQFTAPFAQMGEGVQNTAHKTGSPFLSAAGDLVAAAGHMIGGTKETNRALDPNNDAAKVTYKDVINSPYQNLGGYVSNAVGGAVPLVAAGAGAVAASPFEAATAGGAAVGVGASALLSYLSEFGNSVDSIAARNKHEAPTSDDYKEAAGSTGAKALIDGVAARFGITSGVAKNMVIGAVQSGAHSAIDSLNATGNIDPETVLDAALKGTIGFAGIHGARSALGGVGDRISNIRLNREYSDNPEQAHSDLRVANMYEAKKQTFDSFDAGHEIPADVVFKGVKDDLHDHIVELAQASRRAGDITSEGEAELKDVASKAARHNRETGEDGASSGYFDAEIDRVRKIGLPKNVEDSVVNAIRDLGTVTYNSLKKNRVGPFESAMKTAGRPISAAVGGLTGTVAGSVFGPAGSMEGAALGAYAGDALARSGGRVIDRALGLQEPPILRRAAARRAFFADKGVNPGDTVSELKTAIADAASRRKLVVPPQPAAPDDPLGKFLGDQGVQRNGGWMRTIVEEANKVLPQDKPVGQGDVVDAIKQLVSAGVLKPEHADEMLQTRNGKLDPQVFYGLQDFVIHRAGGLGQNDAPKFSTGGQPGQGRNTPDLPPEIRNRYAYRQTMQNVSDSTQTAVDAAPDPILKAAVSQIANARTQEAKADIYKVLEQRFPQHAQYLTDFVKPLTEYGPQRVSKTDFLRPKSTPVETLSENDAKLGDDKPLEGLPRTYTMKGREGKTEAGPNPVARQAARDYMREAGLPYDPPTKYVKTDPERAARIAKAYDEMQHDPNDPLVKAAWDALRDETLKQWEAIKKTGLKVEFIPKGAPDPYSASPRLALEDIQKNNHFWVFATDDGYGTEGVTAKELANNPMLEMTKETVGGRPARVNDIFRIVHDYFGHAKEGVGFRADGEENAWRSHATMYSPLARIAATAETRGQNSWVNYGPHGEANRNASAADTVYAEQKVGIMPAWVYSEGSEDVLKPVDLDALRREVEANSPVRYGSGAPFDTEDLIKQAKRIANDPAMKSAVENIRGAALNVKDSILNAVPGIKKILPYLEPSEIEKTNTLGAKAIVDMFKAVPSAEEMAAVAFSGRAKRKWYEKSAKTLVSVFGYDDAPRFSALLAALSPQCSVETNAENALNTWVNWDAAGRPTDAASIKRIMGESVQGSGGEDSVLPAWIPNATRALSADDPHSISLSGNKVNAFMANLNDVVHAVTNDAWMANYANVDQASFKGPSYHGYSAKVRQAAQVATRLTGTYWTPREIQETVWSWAKTLYETRDRAGENRTMKDLLKAGAVTHKMIADTPDFATLFTDGVFKSILQRGGYGKRVEEVGSERSSDAPDAAPSEESVYSSEGARIDPRAFQAHLDRAAGRLERLRKARRVA